VDYQLIRIGANIVDQTHADNYPTTITYNGMDFYGIEDLPYINKFLVKVIGSGPAPGSPAPSSLPGPPYSFYLYFELWNPHQQLAGADTTTPSNFRIAPITGPGVLEAYRIGIEAYIPAGSATGYSWYPDPNGTSWNTAAAMTKHFTNVPTAGCTPTSSSGIITFTATPGSYREPAVIQGTSAGWPGQAAGSYTPALNLGTVSNYPPIGTLDQGTGTQTWSTNSPATQTYFEDNCTPVAFDLDVFQIQYQDPVNPNNWHTYGTFEGLANTNAVSANQSGFWESSVTSPVPVANAASYTGDAWVKSDPRTFRFGPGDSTPRLQYANPPVFVNSANYTLTPNATTVDSPVGSGLCPFLLGTSISSATPYRIDMWSVNDASVVPKGVYYTGSGTPDSYTPSYSSSLPYYLDPDGVQRVGDARYSYPNTSPLFAAATTNRPVILHRPFRSVGELGYVYRDMPWKTLDLFSPNSADSGLLDLFTLSDTPVIAGRVNPNTAPAPVLSALLSGIQANYSGSNTNLTASTATAIASAVTNIVGAAPLPNRASLVTGGIMTNNNVNSFSTLKTEREAVVRALAESANTRTWNFMIDIIAQSGNYPKTAATLDNFNVTGERRYWLHIAIDRYTGAIVDKQLEVVNE